MGVRENKVERYLHTQVVKLGGLTRKWTCPTHSGVPDRIVIVGGSVIFTEVKTVDGKLSVPQQREHGRLREVGASVTTVYGHGGVDALIEWIENGGKDAIPHEFT